MSDEALALTQEALASALFIPVEKIVPSARIFDLKPLDSLAFAGLVLELERLTGITFVAEDFLHIHTVSDLANVVNLRRAKTE